MNNTTIKMRQVMDWRAAIQAGIAAGTLLLILILVGYPLFTGGSIWTVFRFIASLLLGRELLLSPDFALGIIILALLMHFGLSIIYSLLLAFVIHRWGLLIGFVGGILFGLALFAINFFTFTALFPWITVVRSWQFATLHVIFGAAAGVIYELLEEEQQLPMEI